MTEISHLGGWEDSVACPQAGHSEFDSWAPSTCWKERTYSWKLPLDHHICSVALHGHSSEPNKCSKNMIPENLSMVVKPVILALGGWKVTVWGPPELHEKRKKRQGKKQKEKAREKRKGKGTQERTYSLFSLHILWVSVFLCGRCTAAGPSDWWPALSCHAAGAG